MGGSEITLAYSGLESDGRPRRGSGSPGGVEQKLKELRGRGLRVEVLEQNPYRPGPEGKTNISDALRRRLTSV